MGRGHYPSHTPTVIFIVGFFISIFLTLFFVYIAYKREEKRINRIKQEIIALAEEELSRGVKNPVLRQKLEKVMDLRKKSGEN